MENQIDMRMENGVDNREHVGVYKLCTRKGKPKLLPGTTPLSPITTVMDHTSVSGYTCLDLHTVGTIKRGYHRWDSAQLTSFGSCSSCVCAR